MYSTGDEVAVDPPDHEVRPPGEPELVVDERPVPARELRSGWVCSGEKRTGSPRSPASTYTSRSSGPKSIRPSNTWTEWSGGENRGEVRSGWVPGGVFGATGVPANWDARSDRWSSISCGQRE